MDWPHQLPCQVCLSLLLIDATTQPVVSVGLTEDQREFRKLFDVPFYSCGVILKTENLAYSFAQNEMLPHAAKWDNEKIFPKEVLRECAALGFGGVFVRTDEEVGGSGLMRQDGVVIFEALATACPSTTAFLTIHNMCAWMIDTYGTKEQRRLWLPDLMSCQVQYYGTKGGR